MTDTSLRPLPILTPDGELPTGDALGYLREAKRRSGYKGLVIPVKALEGSPEPILAVGVRPSWLTRYAHIPDWDVDRLTTALHAILVEPDDPRMEDREDLLSIWFQAPVKLIGEESYGPRFE